jgi:predicted Zn-dependent protease
LNRIAILLVLIFFPVGFLNAPHAATAKGVSLIRDAEIENTIRDYATPVFKAAGLQPDAINIYLVNDNTLNAFVAGGQKIFFHTGLLLKSDNANQIIGVIAHETGHISGGHLSRTHDALSKSSAPAILSYILGGAATLATGRSDVGAAIVAGGQTLGQRSFLKYSRTQEASADHAALKFLDATKQSSTGLKEFMGFLEDQELLSAASQDPYVRSHPLSRDRITTIENHVRDSPYSNARPDPYQISTHARMKAKLYAFLNASGRTFRLYKKSDRSIPARYARAIAYYRNAKIEQALELVDGLLSELPSDPYFHELRGQILFENGRIPEALVSYGKATELQPDSFLIRRELARVQIEANDPKLTVAAINNLKIALPAEPKSAFTWRLLATAYGRIGQKGRSSLALAEEALINGKPDIASYHAGRAERLFEKGSREWIQSQDILMATKSAAKKRKKK